MKPEFVNREIYTKRVQRVAYKRYISALSTVVSGMHMKSADFVISEFKDGRLMFLILLREGKNFRIHRDGNVTYYTWCATEDDLMMAFKIYKAVNKFNVEFKNALKKDQTLKLSSRKTPIYV